MQNVLGAALFAALFLVVFLTLRNDEAIYCHSDACFQRVEAERESRKAAWEPRAQARQTKVGQPRDPRCNPCRSGFVSSPRPGKPCWCDPA